MLIKWLDSHSGNRWQRLEDIEQNGDPVVCQSVGWLLADNRKYKVIVPHVSGIKNAHAVPFGTGDLSIPARSILKMTVLRKG